MPMLTAAQVVNFTGISTSAPTIVQSGLIPVVQERVTSYCFNWFVSDDIRVQGKVTFAATAGTLVIPTGNTWARFGFEDDDEILVYNSRRNDGYYNITSVTTVTLTIDSTESVRPELSGASILVSLVQWPDSLAYAAAQMVKYDYDDRPKRSGGLASQSLGPRSESYTVVGGMAYPTDVIEGLDQFKVARLM